MQRSRFTAPPSFILTLQALTVQQRLVEKVNKKSPVQSSQLDCNILELYELQETVI